MKLLGIGAVALAGMLTVSFAKTGHAGQQPDWLQGHLKKPLSEVTIGFADLGVGVDSYTTAYYNAFKQFAKDLGVKVVVLDAQVDSARQANQVQDLISQHVDALVVWPVNPKAIVPSLRLAHNAGIPVVVTNSAADPSGDKYVAAYTGPDNYTEGEEAGELMGQALGGKGNVVMITCLPGYAVAIKRDAGFHDALRKYPGIKVLESQTGDSSREKSQTLMEDYLTRFGDEINGVYACDDNMGIGALNAIKAAGKAGEIKITSSTLFAVGYDAIKAGEYYGSVAQSPKDDARMALKVAVMAAEAMPVEPNDYIATPPVTEKNVGVSPRPVF